MFTSLIVTVRKTYVVLVVFLVCFGAINLSIFLTVSTTFLVWVLVELIEWVQWILFLLLLEISSDLLRDKWFIC